MSEQKCIDDNMCWNKPIPPRIPHIYIFHFVDTVEKHLLPTDLASGYY